MTLPLVEQYHCFLALDPTEWGGDWVGMAERIPAVRDSKAAFNMLGQSLEVYVLDWDRVAPLELIQYMAHLRDAGIEGPYGGVMFASGDQLLTTNWELHESREWQWIHDRLAPPGPVAFIHTFTATGMELEVRKDEATVVLQHVDHEDPGGIEGSRSKLPGMAFRSPDRFITELGGVLRYIRGMEAAAISLGA